MSIIYIVSGNSLETFYEDTLQYLFDKYHSNTPENTNFTLSEDMEQSAFFAEGFLASDLPEHVPKKQVTRRDRIF